MACLLGVLAVAASGGSRVHAGNALAPGEDPARLVVALSSDVEGRPAPRDVLRARRPLPERRRLLERHPYFRLYVRAQKRHRVPWVLVASVHYQETGFASAPKRARSAPKPRSTTALVMAIAAQLHEAGAPRNIGPRATPALAKRYGDTPAGRVSAAMVIERARAWRLLGTIPAPGDGELARPVDGVTGGCGYFGCPRPGHLHNGIDFLAPTGTPVHAVDGARVAFVQTPSESGGYGNFVCLQHRPHLASCYAHLSAVAAGLREGERVRRGQVIGLVGSTGSSSAPHLHFEVRAGPADCQRCAVDPLPLLSGEVPQSNLPRMLRSGEASQREAREDAAGEQAAAPSASTVAPRATTRAAPGSGGASQTGPTTGSSGTDPPSGGASGPAEPDVAQPLPPAQPAPTQVPEPPDNPPVPAPAPAQSPPATPPVATPPAP